jgi:hypothetical protein
MGAPNINSQTFNEGVGHGGFYAQVFNNGNAIGAGQYFVFSPFDVMSETRKITATDPLGGAIAKAGLLIDRDSSFTVQVPVVLAGGNYSPVALLKEGYTFTDFNGSSWWILECSEAYREGEVWKQNCRATLKLH